mmetsp:Transcript_20666/g.45947  ORF Transcript_20666/g.45947 Transcript_20666/m.45947 type:complete len:222 (-) Transcript_20666:152-817(-)
MLRNFQQLIPLLDIPNGTVLRRRLPLSGEMESLQLLTVLCCLRLYVQDLGFTIPLMPFVKGNLGVNPLASEANRQPSGPSSSIWRLELHAVTEDALVLQHSQVHRMGTNIHFRFWRANGNLDEQPVTLGGHTEDEHVVVVPSELLARALRSRPAFVPVLTAFQITKTLVAGLHLVPGFFRCTALRWLQAVYAHRQLALLRCTVSQALLELGVVLLASGLSP